MHKELGLMCGIEIHQQLEGKKLFCDCPTALRDDDPHFTISRKLRASAGESGRVDIAAKQEQVRDKTFHYQGYKDTTCLVETDSEPPHKVNQDALHTVLQFAKIINADVSPVVQVMRKTVADGSNTSGFQRTALVSRKGTISTSEGKVRIDNISLEEDACKIISEDTDSKTYRLDKLGIPLIEIGTAPDIKSPQQCKEVSQKLGMLLRSLPGVKRGIGTIRQDVNISIKGGNRIEVKGFQNLKMIPQLVELEMKRQQELLRIKEEIKGIKLNSFKVFDLTNLLKKSTSKIISKTIKNKEKIMGIKLKELGGIIGRELQPGNRVGSELSGRAKIKAGVGVIFHSDELPNYGITQKEVDAIKKELKCDLHDAFVLVATSEKRAKIALQAAYERVQELFTGVPKEVRKDNPDGTTSYMRPMPGAARMYPETDVPLIYPETKGIKLPELLEDKIKRFQKQFGLSGDLATLVAKSTNILLFEEIVKKYPEQKPAFIADVLTGMLAEIRRKYNVDTTALTNESFRELFSHLSQNKIHKDIVLDVLIDMAKGEFDLKKYASLGTEDIHSIIKDIVAKNKNAPFPALMGMCMKQLAGKASGKFISEELKKLL
jgi:glutamyl-tRNA(Gln) amidotransferase subunit E